jgi:hypothetical protein
VWIGAQAVDGGGAFTGVTTGVLDVGIGNAPSAFTEFTPGANAIGVRSADGSDPNYSPDAISFEDLIADYDDLTPRQASGNSEVHRPLMVNVRQYGYAWPFGSLRDIEFVRFVVRNEGAPLSNLWVGIYTEFIAVDKNAYSCWPPSSGCSAYGGAFSKKWLAWEDSLRLLRAHYCAGSPVPGGCLQQRVPPWFGLQLLTPPTGGRAVTLAAWDWSPGSPSRDQDTERYAIMSGGTIADVSPNVFPPGAADPVELLATGPFASIATGDSVVVDFAFVGGDDPAAIHVNGVMAQRVYDAGYAQAPTATELSLVSASAAPGRTVLRWYARSLGGGMLRVERRQITGGWESRGSVQAATSGLIEYEDATTAAGERFGYRLAWSEGGAERSGGEVWVTVPDRAAFRLEGARPNPGDGEQLRAAFTLEHRGAVRLALYDLAGRVMLERDAGVMDPGEHTVELRGRTRIAPGIYRLELRQGERRATSRVAVVR